MKFNYDRLANLQREDIAKATFLLLTRHQDQPPHVQVASAATMFLLLCESLDVEPQDAMVVVKNALKHRNPKGEDCFNAVKLYIEHELKHR